MKRIPWSAVLYIGFYLVVFAVFGLWALNIRQNGQRCETAGGVYVVTGIYSRGCIKAEKIE